MLEYILQGQAMMIPLMICSVLAIGVVLDRAWAFYQYRRTDTRSLRSQVLRLLEQGDLTAAAHLCSATPGPVSAVLLSGLQSYGKHKPRTTKPDSLMSIMKETMLDYSDHALAAVEKRFSVLRTISMAAPLMGMTGTVTGMISAFEGMAEAGVSNEAVSSGIAEALITTAAGLIIALIALIPHNYFVAAADTIELEINETTTELLDFVTTRVDSEQAA
ncbi:MAG: MotA/TolQ/ExbB proton channel family protein [Planctomycetes bacterium]|nr:MotA/TolQ/ExbB proton channel family protein [Planctomycetota bacterium]